MRGILHENGTIPSTTGHPKPGAPAPPPRRPLQAFQSPLDDSDIVDALRAALPRDWSHAEIARRTGFHSETVRRYMNGSSRIPASFLAACCRAYGLDPTAVLLPETARDTCVIRLSKHHLHAIAESIGRQALRTLLGPAGRKVLDTPAFHAQDPVAREAP